MDQRLVNLYAAVVRQAFHDAYSDYNGSKGMDARQWLELVGLIDPDGTSRYGTPRRRVGRADEERRELQEV